jgi:hypothetical protein
MIIDITNSSISLSLGVLDSLILLFVILEIIIWKKTGIPLTYRAFIYIMLKSQIERNYLPKTWKVSSLFWKIKYKSFYINLIDSYQDDLFITSACGNTNFFGIIKSDNIINQIKIKELSYPIQIRRDRKLNDLLN